MKRNPTHTPVNMRAALFLATALVVANARSKWRADRAMLPAPATLPGYPANHTQTHNPEQHTHTLAAQMADWPAGCFTQQATHARTAHHRAAATSLGTLQHSTANFPHIFRPCAAPARLPLLCCATAQLCMPWRVSTHVALAHEHTNAHTSTLRAFGIGLRGLETRDDPQQSTQRAAPSPPAMPPSRTQRSCKPCIPPLQSTAKPQASPILSTTSPPPSNPSACRYHAARRRLATRTRRAPQHWPLSQPAWPTRIIFELHLTLRGGRLDPPVKRALLSSHRTCGDPYCIPGVRGRHTRSQQQHYTPAPPPERQRASRLCDVQTDQG